MGVIATLGQLAGAPLLIAAVSAPALLAIYARPCPRPTRGLDGPPHFAIGDRAAVRRRFFTVSWARRLLGLIPGALPWQAGHPSEAITHAALGGGALLALLAAPPSPPAILHAVALMLYLAVYIAALTDAYQRDAAARWMTCLIGIDADMTAAEYHLPGCPRCRREHRDVSGWCPTCRATLEPHRLAPDDWRARIGSRIELERDGRLFAHCGRRMVRSYYGAGGESYRLNRRARRTGIPVGIKPKRQGDPDHDLTIEAAYLDPAKPSFVWARTRERLALSGGDAYETCRIEAWGLDRDRFIQSWVFAPISSRTNA